MSKSELPVTFQEPSGRYPGRHALRARDRVHMPFRDNTPIVAVNMDEDDEAVLFTYALLESRLERLQYLLSGPKAQGEEKPLSIPDRIRSIEASLQQLAGKTALLDNVNELCTHYHVYTA